MSRMPRRTTPFIREALKIIDESIAEVQAAREKIQMLRETGRPEWWSADDLLWCEQVERDFLALDMLRDGVIEIAEAPLRKRKRARKP